MESISDFVVQAVQNWAHKAWNENPAHLIIETILVVFVLYIMVFKRAYDPVKRGYGARKIVLSAEENQELLDEWEPEPLVPATESSENARKAGGGEDPDVVEPVIVDAFLEDGKTVRVIPPNAEGGEASRAAAVEATNYTSSDFLGYGASTEVRDEALQTLDHYTCGSCGPRGFYGTTKAHLDLEESIAKFLGCRETITYSDATSSVSSAVPAFVKRGDLIVVDDGVNHALQTGCLLSRSRCKFFSHNDPEDLERVLHSIAEEDARGPDLSSQQRRFIIVEGLYANSGDVCRLDKVVALAGKYKFRMLVDDSLGFGVLGEHGRGVIEHFKEQGVTVEDIDVLIGSLSTTLASVGGFCAGNQEAVDHQRLSGAGYCFSASCPPFLCSVARRALERMQSRGKGDLAQLRRNIATLREALSGMPEVRVVSGADSPVQLVKLQRHAEAAAAARMDMIAEGKGKQEKAEGSVEAPSLLGPRGGRVRPRTGSDLQSLQGRGKLLLSKVRSVAEADLDGVVLQLLSRGAFVSRSRPVATDMAPPPPSLRVVVSALHSEKDLRKLAGDIRAAVRATDGAWQAASGEGGDHLEAHLGELGLEEGAGDEGQAAAGGGAKGGSRRRSGGARAAVPE